MRRTQPLILAAFILLAALPTAAQAAPEGDATIQVDTFTVNPGQDGDGQAFCPTGSRVVGGGVTSTGAVNANVIVSGPLDATGLTSNLVDGAIGRSWYAKVHNNSPQNTFASTAICSASSDATMRVDFFTIGSALGDGQAFCPGGSRVIGGGVTSTGATNDSVEVSGPLDETGLTSNLTNGDVGRSWYAYVNNNGGGGTNTFASTAICSPGSDATIRVDPFTLTAPGGEAGDGQAFCPTGTRVVGGGVTSTGVPNGQLQVSGPLDETGLTSNLSNGDVGRSWYTNFFGLPGTYVSTAICAPPRSSTPSVTCKGKTATVYAPGSNPRKLSGTPSRDVIVGTSGRDKINAGDGNDLVCAGAGNDKVKGGKGKDKLFGQGGRDKLLGQGGKDLLSGGGRNDTCVGGPGKDTEKSC